MTPTEMTPPAGESLGRARRARTQPTDPYQNQEIPRRVVIYVRVSREEEAEGHSLDAQERECREFLEREKPHWTLVKVFRDTHSGKTAERPEFQRLLQFVYEGQADAILTHRLDRFSRNLHDILTYFRELKDRNVLLAFAKDRFDFSTEEGQLQFRILAVFADWYLSNLSRETRKGKKERVLRGKQNNQLPFGYQQNNAGVVSLVPEEAEGIREAYERYATGNYTDHQIAAHLNELGLTTRRGRQWYKDSVRELLQNETYLGYVKYRGDLYPGNHPAIITQELFSQVQEVRKQHARRPLLVTPERHVYVLSGIARCAHCERSLRAQGGKKAYKYYRDMSGKRGFTDCPWSSRAIRQEQAEEQLARLVTTFRLPADWQQEIREQLALPETDGLTAQRARLEDKLRRLGELYADGVYDRETYTKEREQIQRHLSALVIPEPTVTLEAGHRLEALADIWPYATDLERQEFTRLLFVAVYIDLSVPQIVRVTPQPDFVVFFSQHPYLTPTEDGSYRVDPALWADRDDRNAGELVA